MALRLRTVFAFLVVFFIAFIVVQLALFQWAFIFLSSIFLFVGSVMFAGFLKFAREKRPLLKQLPAASVLIPCYNRADTIERCVKAVKVMSYSKKFEVIVIDDASTDNSLKILEKIPGIKILRQKKNKGKAAALNKALKVAKGEIVACIDADTYVSKNALERMAALFSNERVGAVTALIKPSRLGNLLQKAQEIEYLIGFGFSQSAMSSINSIIVTPGPMAVYKKSLLLKLGGYDENNLTEDMEIALRIRKNGYNIVACPTAKVFTETPDNWRDWLRQRTRWYRGKIFNTFKYRDLIFNPKHGEVGLFGLPFTFMLEMSAVFMLFLIMAIGLDSLAFTIGLLRAYAITGFFSFEFAPLVLNSASIFVNFIILGNFAIGILLSHKLAGEKISLAKLPGIVFIIVGYSLIISAVWLVCLFKEINKSSSQW